MRRIVFPWLVAGSSAAWIAACSLAVQSELDDKPKSAGGAPTADASGMDADAAEDRGLDAPADVAQDVSSEAVVEAGADVADADGSGEDAPGETGACGTCNAPKECCDSACVDVMNDANHCGSCWHACSAGRECNEGVCSSGWVSMKEAPTNRERARACAVWTGDRVFIWGGVDQANAPRDDGLLYDPKADVWEVKSAGPSTPAARAEPVCLWTGTRVFVWGGVKPQPAPAKDDVFNDGALYDPATDTWEALPTDGPVGRARPVALWTGTSAIVWGGTNPADNKGVKSGATWANAWHTISTTGAPAMNKELAGVWDGASLLIFGGRDDGGGNVFNTLFAYKPAPTNTWAQVAPTGTAPAARSSACVALSDSRMMIWGGFDKNINPLGNGARVDLTLPPSWGPLTNTNAPVARACVPFESGWVAVDGSRAYVLGGVTNGPGAVTDGGIYDLANDQWSAIDSWGTELHRGGIGVWTGEEFVVWGGYDGSTALLGGSRWKP